MTSILSAQQFVSKWRQVELKERSASQSHFNDLCALLGQPTPTDADPAGTWYAFEAGATKQSGGEGWADVWKKGYFAWEYKGKHANLEAAYKQLLFYREALLNPPLLVVCDMDRILVHTNFTNTVKHIETFTLNDLLDPARLDLLRSVWSDPDRFRPGQTPEGVTKEAAAKFATLAERLRAQYEPQAVAHFLIRLLFCLFAEDNILPIKIFSKLVQTFRSQPRIFALQLAQLFTAMATSGAFGFDRIPYVDGGLFDDALVLELDGDGLRTLAEVCALDWGNVEPSILGTLFERGLDPAKRAQLGAHYTGRDDILLVVEPVLMAPLRRRWEQVRSEAYALAAARDASNSPRIRAKRQASLEALLTGFSRELARLQVLDPACGSGNFLYVALKQLLDLWKEVSTLGFRLGLPARSPLEGEAPYPSQLHGIEINPYAHELAQITIWIGYLQWLRDNGFGQPAEPILKPLQTVTQMDAILTYDAEGRPTEPEWPVADVIVGNPPFLGGGKIRSELGDRYTEALFQLYGDRIPSFSDLVCYWFEKARAIVEQGKAKRVGLLATQGIRGGANRTVLKRIKDSGDIFMAWADRPWVLEGAAVHVSMVGFDKGVECKRELDGKPVEHINPDLTTAVDLAQAEQLVENAGWAFIGPSPKAPFDIDEKTARRMLDAPLNVNGRPNSDVVRPVVSAVDLVQRSRKLWTIDFGAREYEEAVLFEKPFEYVKQVVLPARQTRRDDYRGQWWQYARPRPGLQAAIIGKSRMIVTSRIAKHHIFVWVSCRVLANDGTVVIAREDDYILGVLQSRPHRLWALRQGTQLESRPRYTPTTCFETYPFPWPPGKEPQGSPLVEAIAAAARELVKQRDAWLNPEGADESELKRRTLTNLYNANPTWLQLAHCALDVAVLAAYGWPADLSDEELLRRLLELNLARTGSAVS